MKKLLANLKDYKKECIIAPLLKCLEAMVDLLVPLLMARLVDQGIAPGNREEIIRVGIYLFALALIGLLFSVTAQWFSAKAATSFARIVRSKLFKHIQSLSFSSADQIGTDTLITRLTSDINQCQTGINLTLRLLLRSPFIVFGSMIMAFQVDVPSAWIFAITIPVLAIVVYGVMWITLPLYKKVQARLDTVLMRTRENLTGVRVIRAFNLQSKEKEAFEDDNLALTTANKLVGRFSALTNPLTYVLINIATAILLYSGAVRVNTGYLTQGQVIALLNYMAQILVELVKLANLIVTMTRAAASMNRIETILEVESDMAYPAESPAIEEGSVVFDHVSMRYPLGGEDALTDISFTAQPGETVGIIGGTGSGKTTLVNLIPRFYDTTSGSVMVGGRDVKDYTKASLSGALGAVLQKAVLFKGTIRENLLFGNENATEEELWEALENAQAAEFVRQKPKGLDEEIEQGGRNLSGGQRQRLSIARALVRHPKVLILDDSSSALDFATDAALRRAVRALKDHPTTFIVSQRIASIMYADKILVMSDGTLAAQGTHDELMASSDVYQEIYHSQFKEETRHEQ